MHKWEVPAELSSHGAVISSVGIQQDGGGSQLRYMNWNQKATLTRSDSMYTTLYTLLFSLYIVMYTLAQGPYMVLYTRQPLPQAPRRDCTVYAIVHT